jgi:5-methylthioadenosine/S-adenosylhomocysteine deaminase
MAERKIIIPKRIVTVDENDSILINHFVEIENDKIVSIKSVSEKNLDNLKKSEVEIIRKENLTLIPGFVQTHIHLCQTLLRGYADDLELLDWLQTKIFPFENALDKDSLRASVRLGINELFRGGTTTILDMGTLHYQEIIFEELINSGMRAFAGKCMMDVNDLYPQFKSKTEDELKESYELAKQFHNMENEKINYGFAPRFALSCSEKLLKETKEMMEDFPGSIFHTHSSENKNESEQIKKKFKMNNAEYYNHLGLLDSNSVLAHCIHVNDDEINILKETNTRVAHCPSANLKLGSGIANIPRYLKEGINVSIGSDGAPCNNNLNAFMEMRLAALIQKPFHGAASMDSKTVFRLATIEGAKALHIENEIGSIEAGKNADLVLIDLDSYDNSVDSDQRNIFSDLVYSTSPENVVDVMINGEWVVKDKNSLKYDTKKLRADAEMQIKYLLKRI